MHHNQIERVYDFKKKLGCICHYLLFLDSQLKILTSIDMLKIRILRFFVEWEHY